MLCNMALAIPKLPSLFSKSIRFTLWTWHWNRSLTGFNLLFEVLHRHVLPEVTVQVYQNRIDALHGIENRSQIVVIGNLGRIFLTLQPQLISHKIIAERLPIVTGVGHMMGIVIPRRSAELGCNGARFKHLQLAFQTIGKYPNFFPQTGD